MTQLNDQYLKYVEVKNPELLAILDNYAGLPKIPGFAENCHCTSKERMRQRNWYVGPKYMQEIVDEGTQHEGFPDEMVGYNFKLSDRAHQMFEPDADPIFKRDMTHMLSDLNDKMMNFLSVKHNALAAVYPPGGFIAWHNNANAPGFNLIFSYSESGSGWFDYIHPETKEVVRCQDKPGQWTCKAAYFGHYGEEEKLMYHAASSEDDWRVTVSYVFDWSETSEEFREMVLEDIASE